MAADFIGGLIFGSVGFIAFIYGKKMAQYRMMTIGLILMVFPYVISGNLALYGIGSVLTLALFVWRD